MREFELHPSVRHAVATAHDSDDEIIPNNAPPQQNNHLARIARLQLLQKLPTRSQVNITGAAYSLAVYSQAHLQKHLLLSLCRRLGTSGRAYLINLGSATANPQITAGVSKAAQATVRRCSVHSEHS